MQTHEVSMLVQHLKKFQNMPIFYNGKKKNIQTINKCYGKVISNVLKY